MPKLFNCIRKLFTFFSGCRLAQLSAALQQCQPRPASQRGTTVITIALSGGDKQNDQQKTNIDNQSASHASRLN